MQLCENYQRPPKPFIVAEGAEDTVKSEVIFRAADGKELKPPDYLKIFEEFVKKNPQHIDAIDILLNKPKDFHTRDLKELRIKLETSPDTLRDKFSEKNLRKAYHQNLADIISIVRHAAKGEPLITVETRVDRALAKVRARHTFSGEQERWLGLIRHHLIENLLIEKDDIELPIFTREGVDFHSLDKVFDGHLEDILDELNEAVLT